jgi:acyl-CoA synthetase (NDP forming)
MINTFFTDPKSIAVIGASNNLEKPGSQMLLNLIRGGFSGKLYPVHPNEKAVHGLSCFNTLDELPQTDMAILAIPAGSCVSTVEKLAELKGTKAFIIASAGFGESGSEGKYYEQQLKELTEKYKLAILGPNCVGALNANYKAFFVSYFPELQPGGVDFVSASGAFAVFVFELAAKMGLRFGEIYSVGNSVDIGIEQVLQYWDEKYIQGKSGRVKLVYAEQIKYPKLLYKHIFNLRKKGCDVLVIKPGESDSGARAALSHTGAMAGDNEAINFLIQKAGAFRCQSREELVYLANIISQHRLKGDRIAVITHAGGPAVMLCDQLQKNKLLIPELDPVTQKKLSALLHPGSSLSNPVDILATGSRLQLAAVLDIVDQLDYIDGIIVIYGKTGLDNLYETFELLHEKIITYSKPVYAVLPSISTAEAEIGHFIKLGHGCYTDEVELAGSLGQSIKEPKVFQAELLIPKITSGTGTIKKILPQDETERILKEAGIPFAETYSVKNIEELERLMPGLRFPLVAKASGLLHKTESGGVITGINNPDELLLSFGKLTRIKEAKGVIIQEMLHGIELFLGGKQHPGIGYSVHTGLGGIFVELMEDRISSLAPVTIEEAEFLIGRLKKQQLFDGFRNMPSVNRNTFATIISNFSNIFINHPEIAEIDLNPLIAAENRIVVVDARIIMDIVA